MTQQVYLRCGWRLIDPLVALARSYQKIGSKCRPRIRAQKTQYTLRKILRSGHEMTPFTVAGVSYNRSYHARLPFDVGINQFHLRFTCTGHFPSLLR